jgi:hypothetical protein
LARNGGPARCCRPKSEIRAGAGPLVWETFRGKVEIFNLTKDDAGNYVPPGYSAAAPDYGYNTPPAYFYRTRSVPACPGQTEPASPAWVNIDETTEIELAQMFAGGPAIQDSANTSPQLIRFAVKANHVEYEYAAKNQYFISRSGSAKETAAKQCERLCRGRADRAAAAAARHQLYAGHGRDQERLAATQCLR